MFIASRLTDKNTRVLKQMFVSMDTSGNGYVNRIEFERALKQSKIRFKNDDIENILKVLDTNHNGSIDYIEFITSCISNQKYVNSGILKSAFEFYDLVCYI